MHIAGHYLKMQILKMLRFCFKPTLEKLEGGGAPWERLWMTLSMGLVPSGTRNV